MAAPTTFFAVIAGVGPGTGRATALRFARAYPVALLARSPDSYADLVREIRAAGGEAVGVSADTSDPASVARAFASIRKHWSPDWRLAAAVFNVGAGFAVKPFLDVTSEELSASLVGNAGGLFNFAQNALPLLLDSVDHSPHPPTLLVTGATASVKGSSRFGTFAAGKFAKRALAQSLAREFGPQGVHVAHVIIDGAIDTPKLKEIGYKPNNAAPDGLISPDAIADTYWHLHTQHRSAFTQEVDLRPYVEKF
ncbi:oxidoreductase [Gaeumannomyces tritici R3-111a-1]|uniref:Oxidoreductase n=1 Tax=Gaeumannomyces tritici (strain R3-111a-1) TaxID=644352 RepID=J3PB82_GAET3|nr:oxidoreductase [Gaeumannomyces tritici R3-111a-1]EJT71498.1 oxidoreductase [Gaeumannomyces tritici R3-111a-1]